MEEERGGMDGTGRLRDGHSAHNPSKEAAVNKERYMELSYVVELEGLFTAPQSSSNKRYIKQISSGNFRPLSDYCLAPSVCTEERSSISGPV